MEHDGITTHGEAPGASRHHNHLQHLWRHLQLYRANVERVFMAVAQHQHRLRLRVIAQHRYFNSTFTIGIHMEHTQRVGLAIHPTGTEVAYLLYQFY